MIFFSKKIISIETSHEIYNQELLAIAKMSIEDLALLLENSKHNVLILTSYNNLCYFMNMKSLSSCQI